MEFMNKEKNDNFLWKSIFVQRICLFFLDIITMLIWNADWGTRTLFRQILYRKKISYPRRFFHKYKSQSLKLSENERSITTQRRVYSKFEERKKFIGSSPISTTWSEKQMKRWCSSSTSSFKDPRYRVTRLSDFH